MKSVNVDWEPLKYSKRGFLSLRFFRIIGIGIERPDEDHTILHRPGMKFVVNGISSMQFFLVVRLS